MKTVLTIAGSDPCGGAGIQADLKTFAVHGVYGMSVITAITAQNTVGVLDVFEVPVHSIESQLDAVFTDIFPDAVKIGMVYSAKIIEAVSKKLDRYRPKNIVIDPVMVATGGQKLLAQDAAKALTGLLFPQADLITPNIPEAEGLCGFSIGSKEDMARAAVFLGEKYRSRILLKGGHMKNGCDDLLYNEGNLTWFSGKRMVSKDVHGTGCTLSSAIAAGLAKDMCMEMAIQKGKVYVAEAILSKLDLGQGSALLNHSFMY